MTSRRKTWQEKLTDKEGLPKVLKLESQFPGGDAVHKVLLEQEGFKVIAAGQRWRVENFQAYMADIL